MSDSALENQHSGCRSSILLLSATFPPRGGSGVQRVMYQAEYLTQLGHEVWVVTEQPEKVWVRDSTLCAESVSECRINRLKQYPAEFIRIVDRGLRRFAVSPLYPDDFALWAIAAYRRAATLVRLHEIDSILVSLGHPSALIVAFFLKRRFPELKLLIDVRDLWAGSPVAFMGRGQRRIRQWIDKSLERLVFEYADGITTVSDGLKAEIQRQYPDMKSSVDIIYNGYDEETFSKLENATTESTAPRRVRIIYTGFVIPEQRPEVFFQALSRLHRESPDSVKQLRVEFYGGSQAYVSRLASDHGVTNCVESHSYVTHSEAIKHMCDADLLLLFRVPHSGVLSGKLFEYMRSGTPILAFDQGNMETREILSSTGCGEWVSIHDCAGQVEALQKLLSGEMHLSEQSESQVAELTQYSRLEQTRRLSDIIESIVNPGTHFRSSIVAKEAA